ncbi:MAG: GNAT family N-acetyltransferase [Verrucomicrobiales bacterium]|nr:GNAT family N-acetyltransferase [Verrucomicrobiales bacterium]
MSQRQHCLRRRGNESRSRLKARSKPEIIDASDTQPGDHELREINLGIGPPDCGCAAALCREAGARCWEVRAAQTLRFEVFNLELNEGLAQSYVSGFDEDPFDAACDHLIVEHLPSQRIVGTFRLQTGRSAAKNLGYYCAQEFEFAVFEPLRSEMIELGRACVHRQYRNLVVLGMLWKGIADYARQHGARYLFGCSSITSQDPAVGASAYADLCRKRLVEPQWRTRPLAAFDCPLSQLAAEPVQIPKLLRAYLTLGAKICGPPALDPQFKTIDFLTLLDLNTMSPLARQRFLC